MFTNSISLNLPQDLDEYIVQLIDIHYLTLFRLVSKDTLDISNRRFIHFITRPVYKGTMIYDPLTNYKYWKLNQLNLPSSQPFTKKRHLIPHLKNDENIEDLNIPYTKNDKWFNYIINNMRVLKRHLIKNSTHKQLYIGSSPNTSISNYKEWKKNQLGLDSYSSIKKNDLNTYRTQDNFKNTKYNKSCDWFNYIKNNMKIPEKPIYKGKNPDCVNTNYSYWRQIPTRGNLYVDAENNGYLNPDQRIWNEGGWWVYQQHFLKYDPSCPWYNYIRNNYTVLY